MRFRKVGPAGAPMLGIFHRLRR
ncbi:hypothetical protein LINGRAPRIM_LOCUS531 [Linum grandiflorum]